MSIKLDKAIEKQVDENCLYSPIIEDSKGKIIEDSIGGMTYSDFIQFLERVKIFGYESSRIKADKNKKWSHIIGFKQVLPTLDSTLGIEKFGIPLSSSLGKLLFKKIDLHTYLKKIMIDYKWKIKGSDLTITIR